MAPASKRRKLGQSSRQELDVDGDQDWQSDELSSLPGSDEDDDEEFDEDEEEEDDDSQSGDDESLPPTATSSTVQIVIPTPAPEKRKRGRPRKDPADKPPKIPKKRGRPRKYAPGEAPKYRRSRRKLNPDGSFKKRGRPKKVINPDDVVVKVPKKRGRPRKNPLADEEEGSGKRRKKKEFDLLAGLDLDFEDDDSIAADEGEEHDQGESRTAETEDDILAKLRRRILYRQQDAELQDFVETPKPATPRAGPSSSVLDAGPRTGLPVLPERSTSTSAIPSSEKRKERQPFEPGANEDGPTESVLDPADTPVKRPKGRPPGTKNKQPDWQNNPLFRASRGAAASEAAEDLDYEEDRGASALGARTTSAGAGAAVARANGMSNLVKPTSSDAFFLFNTSKKARGAAGLAIGTSTTLISSKLGALQPSSLEDVVYEQTQSGTIANAACQLYRRLLPVYTAQLLAGYSIVFHGVGSKVDLLTELVRDRIESHGDAVGIVAQGAIKAFKVEDMLAQIESAVGLGPLSSATAHQEQDQDHTSTHVASTLTVSRARRVATYFGPQQQQLRCKRKTGGGPTRLFLILETFDAPGMQNARFRSVLDILGACKDIHIMATVEHVNSGLVIGSHHGSAPDAETGDGAQGDAKRLTWIWQNISTFVPSLNEMLVMRSNTAFSSWMPALPSSLDLLGSTGRLHAHSGVGAAGEGASVSLFNGLAVSEATANISRQSAISILKSVTTKARALFNLVAKQILAMPSGDPAPTTREGIAYADLLTKAKKGFLVSNEADFKSLLVEFLDHQLLQITRQGTIRVGLESQQVTREVVEQMKTL